MNIVNSNPNIHECIFCIGKIGDVTLRNDIEIYCRRCGIKLNENQVEETMLRQIKDKNKRR